MKEKKNAYHWRKSLFQICSQLETAQLKIIELEKEVLRKDLMIEKLKSKQDVTRDEVLNRKSNISLITIGYS